MGAQMIQKGGKVKIPYREFNDVQRESIYFSTLTMHAVLLCYTFESILQSAYLRYPSYSFYLVAIFGNIEIWYFITHIQHNTYWAAISSSW
jgi:hypothetical protein